MHRRQGEHGYKPRLTNITLYISDASNAVASISENRLKNCDPLVKDYSFKSLKSSLPESLEAEPLSGESFSFKADCVKYHESITTRQNYVKRLPISDKSNFEGNKKDNSALLDSLGPPDRSTQAVQAQIENGDLQEKGHMYKLSLSVKATAEEQTVFDNYRKKIETSGWSLTPMQASKSEKVAYIAIPKGSRDELQIATRLTECILKQAFKETYGARR
jgi:hypothetical protein